LIFALTRDHGGQCRRERADCYILAEDGMPPGSRRLTSLVQDRRLCRGRASECPINIALAAENGVRLNAL
jgi:hypothetical protein